MHCKHKCVGSCLTSNIIRGLLIIGGLNWGLVGAGILLGSDWNVLAMFLGAWPSLLAVVYLLVGVAAVGKIFGCCCKKCKEACAECGAKDGDQNMGQKI